MYNNNNSSGYGGGYGSGGYNSGGGYGRNNSNNNNNNNNSYYGGGGGYNNPQQMQTFNSYNNDVNRNNNNYDNNPPSSSSSSYEEDVSKNPDYQATAKTIQQIQGSVANLQRLVQQLGTPRDTMDIRDKIRSCVESTTSLISQESSKVKVLSTLAVRTRDNKNKLLYQKLVKEFNYCLQQFKETAQVATKKEKSTPLPPPTSSSSNHSYSSYNSNYSQQQQQLTQQYLYDENREDETQSLMESSRRQQLAQVESEREYQNSIIQERDEGIKKIEQSIVEINEIFLDLSNLVSEQGVMLNTIENSVISSAINTKEGVEQIRKASEYQRSSRTKMCWLALILIVVAGVLAVILYFSLRGRK
eukprot:gene2343-2891_t